MNYAAAFELEMSTQKTSRRDIGTKKMVEVAKDDKQQA